MATIQSELAKIFVAGLRPVFQARGFKKNRNNYWRELDGVSQVIAFQLPPFDPPFRYGEPEPPDPNIGRIFLELGVAMLDGVGFYSSGKPPSVSGCEFRITAEGLAARDEPFPWRLTDVDAIRSDLENLLPAIDEWFEGLASLDAALNRIETSQGGGVPSRWRAIRSRHERGERELAQMVIDAHIGGGPLNKSHFRLVESFAAQHGYSIPREKLALQVDYERGGFPPWQMEPDFLT